MSKSTSNEPTSKGDAADYAFDGEEESPQSPGMKQFRAEEGGAFSLCDRVTNIIALAFLFIILIMSILSIAAGACCLASVSGKPFKNFSFFLGFGVTPVVIGVVCLILVVAVLLFIALCAMGLGRYGMCCYGASCCRATLRVLLLGVFPFVVIIILLAMIIIGFTFFSLSQQLAPLDRDYTKVKGIVGNIEIARDENGLTHIKASSRRDAYFGQGFAEAQDRLFQLDFHRLTAMGELSYNVGKDAHATDVMMRTLNIKKAAQALCAQTPAEDLAMLQAFADGVNLFMQRVSKRPVEFFFVSRRPLYFHDPRPFSALDMCLTARLFQFQMSSNFAAEGQRFSIWAATNRNYAQMMELEPDFAKDPSPIFTPEQEAALTATAAAALGAAGVTPIPYSISSGLESKLYDNIMSIIRTQLQQAAAAGGGASSARAPQAGKPLAPGESFQSRVAAEARNVYRAVGADDYLDSPTDVGRALKQLRRDPVFANKFVHASNAWAARTADGHAIVASDPHLTINLPSIWYWVHLSYPTEENTPYDAAGVGMVGLPGVHIGQTTHIAWGITMSKTDLEDLFILPPAAYSGLGADQYMYGGKLRTLVTRHERVVTKGMKDVVLELKDSLLGPIVSSMLGFPDMLQVALFAVPLRTDDSTSVTALLGMSDSHTDTAEKMMNNLLDLQSPGFSIPIADRQGNIAYAMTGRHPARGPTHTGLFPGAAFDAAGLLTALAAYPGASTGATPPMEVIMAAARQYMGLGSAFVTYAATEEGGADTHIPKEANPHVHIPFNNDAAHISAANQLIVSYNYPVFWGADYSWSWRGTRVKEMLDAAIAAGTVNDTATHMAMQLDHQSNMWLQDIKPVVESAAFQALIADDANAKSWSDRLLAWDGVASIGNIEASFLWKWIEKMTILPRDAVAASGAEGGVWPATNRYLGRSLSAEATPTMIAECVDYMQTVKGKADATGCVDFAAATFQEMAADTGFNVKWGQDVNRLHTLHEMLSKKIIHPIWRREIDKAGDHTSVGVSDHAEYGDFESTQAASMRQVYDLKADTAHLHLAFPGGNSGNPYSKWYDNMLEIYARDEYVSVVAEASAWGEINGADGKKGSKQHLEA